MACRYEPPSIGFVVAPRPVGGLFREEFFAG